MRPTGARRPSAFAAEPAIRRSVLLAAGIWVGMHVVHAVVYADAVVHPAGTVLGLVCIVLGSVLVLRPLWCRAGRPAFPGEAVVAAASVPLASLLDLGSAVPGSVLGYANWANGACAVVLLALVLRRHGWLGIGAAVLLAGVQTTDYVSLPGPVTAAAVAQLTVPTSLWLLGSWAVRGALSRADAATVALTARRAADAADRLVREERVRAGRRHHLEMEEEALPLLQLVVASDPGWDVPQSLRGQVRDLSADLRDGLLARSLMSRELRRCVQAARTRGTRVVLHNELDDGPPVDALRRLVAGLLEVPGLATISVRTFTDPAEATVVLRGAEQRWTGPAAVHEVVGTSTEQWGDTQVLDLGDDVMVRLTGVAAPLAATTRPTSQSVASVTEGS